MWTKSACVVLAWSILIILVAVGTKGSARPVQANIRIASSTSSTSSTSGTSSTEVTLTSTLSVAAAPATATSPAARYVVQPGDTLSGIAARFGVRGGWPALYAANRRVIGPDPNVIRPGTVLTVVRAAAPSPPASSPGRRPSPAPPSAPAGSGHRPAPGKGTPATAGMPQWLKTMLLAVGLLIGAAFLAEPVLMLRRRRQAAARAAGLRMAGSGQGAGSEGQGPGSGRLAPEKARVVLADYDRVVVTCRPGDGTVYVLRPPGEDPRAILRAARLVLPEGPYGELAEQLGVPAGLPME